MVTRNPFPLDVNRRFDDSRDMMFGVLEVYNVQLPYERRLTTTELRIMAEVLILPPEVIKSKVVNTPIFFREEARKVVRSTFRLSQSGYRAHIANMQEKGWISADEIPDPLCMMLRNSILQGQEIHLLIKFIDKK